MVLSVSYCVCVCVRYSDAGERFPVDTIPVLWVSHFKSDTVVTPDDWSVIYDYRLALLEHAELESETKLEVKVEPIAGKSEPTDPMPQPTGPTTSAKSFYDSLPQSALVGLLLAKDALVDSMKRTLANAKTKLKNTKKSLTRVQMLWKRHRSTFRKRKNALRSDRFHKGRKNRVIIP